MKEFVYKGNEINVRQAMQNNIAGMGKGLALQLVKEREVKINGARATQNSVVREGDVVRVYFDESVLFPRVVFSDNNIIVVDKRAGIETSDGEGNLLQLMRQQFGEVFAVHRLDANTRGLVMFAKNMASEKELKRAIKNRTVVKKYRAVVVGVPKRAEDTLVGYLVKDAAAARVKVFSTEVEGSKKIVTRYKVVGEENGNAVLEVELVTGATHQIRAHLAHINHPIVGDNVYGIREQNRAAKKRYQCLVATSIALNGLGGELAYLNGKTIYLSD